MLAVIERKFSLSLYPSDILTGHAKTRNRNQVEKAFTVSVNNKGRKPGKGIDDKLPFKGR